MRKRTNSMTELCKDIAREIYDEWETALWNRLQGQISIAVSNAVIKIEKFSKPIIGPKERTGHTWESFEDIALKEELADAINQIAEHHNRSTEAILCRIVEKEVLDSIPRTS